MSEHVNDPTGICALYADPAACPCWLCCEIVAGTVEGLCENCSTLARDTRVSAQTHLDAWADTGDGYTRLGRLYVLKCLWCPETFMGETASDALAKYEAHEDEIRTLAGHPRKSHEQILAEMGLPSSVNLTIQTSGREAT